MNKLLLNMNQVLLHNSDLHQLGIFPTDWFLSFFQIFDVKPELSLVKLKVRKNGLNSWAKILFQKNFPWLFFSPNESYLKKSGQNGL